MSFGVELPGVPVSTAPNGHTGDGQGLEQPSDAARHPGSPLLLQHGSTQASHGLQDSLSKDRWVPHRSDWFVEEHERPSKVGRAAVDNDSQSQPVPPTAVRHDWTCLLVHVQPSLG